jgi:hypothetical protein
MLSCQSEFGHHDFLVFLLASSIAIPSPWQFLHLLLSILLQPRWVWLRSAKTSKSAQYNWGYGRWTSGDSGWAARSIPLALVAKICTGLGVQPFRPNSPSIAKSMPGGASNSHCMCLACGPFRHLGWQTVHARHFNWVLAWNLQQRRRGGVTEDTGHPGEERWWATCADEQGCRHDRRFPSNPSRPSDAQ